MEDEKHKIDNSVIDFYNKWIGWQCIKQWCDDERSIDIVVICDLLSAPNVYKYFWTIFGDNLIRC